MLKSEGFVLTQVPRISRSLRTEALPALPNVDGCHCFSSITICKCTESALCVTSLVTDEILNNYQLLCHSLGSSVHYWLPDGPSQHWLLFFDLMVHLIFSPSNSLFIQLMFAQVLHENAAGDFPGVRAVLDHCKFLMMESSHKVTSAASGKSVYPDLNNYSFSR